MLVPDLSRVRRNTTRNKPSIVEKEEYVKIQEDFYKLHKFVTLVDNVVFSNRNAFMIA